jgi:ABC-type glycerol-3-phosphate transport system permease component
VAALLPIYLLVKRLGMLDTIWTMVILYTSMNMPLAVWMMRSFLLVVPREVLAGLFPARLCAAATLASLPVLIAGWVARNEPVRGLSMGAVK